MPKNRTSRDWDDEDDYDPIDEGYGDDDDAEVDTIDCPKCGAEIYEDAEECPHCGEYILRSNGGTGWFTDRPLWIIVTLIVLLGVFALYSIG